MILERRQFLRLAAGAGALIAGSRLAQARTYPIRPVHILVGFPPGLGIDIYARLLAQPLSERLGQQIVVDNRPGGGSNIATETMLRAPADGYTLLFAASANAFNATLFRGLNFNFIRDAAPIASVGRTPFVMVVNSTFPAKTVPEFVTYAKANPGKINVASPGIGTANHVFGELFSMMTGIDMVHVPYRGSFMPDLLAGQVQVAFIGLPAVIEYVRGGQLRALAVTTAERVETLPDTPAVGESVPGYEASAWNGIVGPRNISSDVVETLNTEINAIISNVDVKTRLLGLGVAPIPMTPAEFGKFIANETEKWARVIRAADIRPE